jgi:hypothetical protein
MSSEGAKGAGRNSRRLRRDAVSKRSTTETPWKIPGSITDTVDLHRLAIFTLGIAVLIAIPIIAKLRPECKSSQREALNRKSEGGNVSAMYW